MPVLANLRHEIFCQNQCKGLGLRDSYEQAGYKYDDANACNLKSKPHIQARIQEIMTKAATRVEVTASRIIQEMAKLAFHNPADYLTLNDDGTATVDLSTLDRDQASAITEVISDKDEKGNTKTKIKLADKKAALETLGKHFGLWVERTEHGQPGDFTNIGSMDDLEAKLREELGPEDAQNFMKLVRPEKMN
jgi:phage terminase small subunit